MVTAGRVTVLPVVYEHTPRESLCETELRMLNWPPSFVTSRPTRVSLTHIKHIKIFSKYLFLYVLILLFHGRLYGGLEYFSQFLRDVTGTCVVLL